MEYNEQIKHPSWQRRRLEILSRDNFTCQICGSRDRALHVHHLVYEKGRMIWDYPDSRLITLCEECHECEHADNDALYEALRHLRSLGVTNKELVDLLRFVEFRISKGDQRIFENILGDNYDPGIDVPYIKILARRREDTIRL